MRKFIYLFLFSIFVYLAYGLTISQWTPVENPQNVSNILAKRYYDYSGVVNVMTNKSLGSGSLSEVMSAANFSGLDFVVITDAHNYEPDRSVETYYDKTLALIGGRYNYLNSRLLNFDFVTTDHLQGFGRSQFSLAEALSDKDHNRPEGIFYLSHPTKPGFEWKGSIPPGIDGIEIINLKWIWQNAWLNSKLSFIASLLIYPFNSNLAYLRMLSRGFQKEISLWDSFNRQRPTRAIAGAEAQAKIRFGEFFDLNIPAYATLFSIARNHVLLKSELTGQSSGDYKKISDSLRRGQFYIALDILQDPKGFASYIRTASGDQHLMGAERPLASGDSLIVELPKKPQAPFEVIILKDGDVVMTSNSISTTYELHSSGVYRCVVRLKIEMPFPDNEQWFDWIITNPFFISDEVK